MDVTTDKVTLIADPIRRTVGCVIIQAMAGCDQYAVQRLGFDPCSWDVSPMAGQKRISGTPDEWRKFAAICNEAHGRKELCLK